MPDSSYQPELSLVEKRAEAARLRALDWKYADIAAHLGTSTATAYRWANPDFDERSRAASRLWKDRNPEALAVHRAERSDRQRKTKRDPDPAPVPGLIPVRSRKDGRLRVIAFSRVDIEDWHRFRHFRWQLVGVAGDPKYVATSSAIDGRPVYLHRLILGLTESDELECDHINRNPLDNKRFNLRKVTRKENCANRGGMFEKGRPIGVYS
jgi:hypothetical protein